METDLIPVELLSLTIVSIQHHESITSKSVAATAVKLKICDGTDAGYHNHPVFWQIQTLEAVITGGTKLQHVTSTLKILQSFGGINLTF